MQNFPIPNRSFSGFPNFPSPSKLRWGFPDFRSSVIKKVTSIPVEDLLWTPAEITTALWLDASDDSTVTIDTGVSVWADKSGNSLDFSQGNTVLQPAYVTDYENGLNALSFAGHSLSRLETVGDDVSLFIAFKPRTTVPSSSFRSLMTQKSGTLYSEYLLANYSGYSDLAMKNDFSSSGAAVGLDFTITADQPEIFCFTYNDGLNTDVSNYGIHRNGTTETVITTSNLGRGGGESACIGSRNSEDFFFDGHIYEIITVSGVVDADTRQKVEGYLAHKWGFSANLPVDHPYKDAAPTTAPTAEPVFTGPTWNPADKHADVTLSNNNLTATSDTTNWSAFRANISKSTGKWYFEILVDTAGTYTSLGVGSSSATLNKWPGDDIHGWGWMWNSRFYHNKSYTSGPAEAYGSSGDIGMIALDLDAGKLWFGKNGSWFSSGDPATGANPIFTGVSGELFPIGFLYLVDTVMTIKSGADACTYDLPIGFDYWGETG